MKIYFLIITLILLIPKSTQAICYEAFRKDNNLVLSKSKADHINDYSPQHRNDSSLVKIDRAEKQILIDNNKYEFNDLPKKWAVFPEYRLVKYECINLQNLNKAFIYLIEYTKTTNRRFVVIEYGETKSIVVYGMKIKED